MTTLAPFSPPLRRSGGGRANYYFRVVFDDDPRRRAHLQPLGTGPPAEAERATYQPPVAANGRVAPYLVIAPSQGVLDLLVALLDPHPQTVEPNHLPDARRGQQRRSALLSRLLEARGWQVGGQVPGEEAGQPLRIGGDHQSPLRLLGTIRSRLDLQSPPRLLMAVSEGAYHPPPLPRIVRVVPSGGQGRLPQCPYRPLHMPPRVRILQREHVPRPELAQCPPELVVLAVKRVCNHRPKGHASGHRASHELLGYLGLGAEARVGLAALEVVLGRVGLDLQRIVDPLIGPQATDAHHSVFGLAHVAKPLLAHVGRLLAPLAIAVLVYDQNAILVRNRRRVREGEL